MLYIASSVHDNKIHKEKTSEWLAELIPRTITVGLEQSMLYYNTPGLASERNSTRSGY